MDKLREAAREVVRQHSMECLSDKTVEALREALAEPQVDWKEEAMRLGGLNAKHVGELRKLEAEQAEQELLMITPGGGAFPFAVVGEIEQAEQEPVAWAYMDADGSFMDALNHQHGAYQTPLYTTPPSVEAAVKAMRDKVETIAHNIGEFAGVVGSQEQCDTLNGYVTELFAAIRSMK